MIEVGQITRTEVDHVVVAYGFDLRTNEIDTKLIANPNRGGNTNSLPTASPMIREIE